MAIEEEGSMDINAALDNLRENVQTALGEVYRDTEMTTERGQLLEELLRDIAETFDNIDQSLTRGGFMPATWGEAHVHAGAVALWEAFPNLTEDYSYEWFHKAARTVLNARSDES